MTTGLGPVYDGIGHLLMTPEDLVPILALALYAGLRGARAGRLALFVLPVAWLAGGLCGLGVGRASSAPVPALSFILLGILVAADVKLPDGAVAALARGLGLVHGFLNGPACSRARAPAPSASSASPPSRSSSSRSRAALVVSLKAPAARIAVRVAGSWIAAIGLLLLGWAFRTRGGRSPPPRYSRTMSNTMGALLFFGTAFLVTLGCLEAGIRIGRRALSGPDAHRPAGLGTVETVAFGVLGLLLAFTFSGASSRFDARRALVVEEANDIGTAWLRLDLLPAASQPPLRDAFRRYTDSRILMYQKVADLDFDGARDRVRPGRSNPERDLGRRGCGVPRGPLAGHDRPPPRAQRDDRHHDDASRRHGDAPAQRSCTPSSSSSRSGARSSPATRWARARPAAGCTS